MEAGFQSGLHGNIPLGVSGSVGYYTGLHFITLECLGPELLRFQEARFWCWFPGKEKLPRTDTASLSKPCFAWTASLLTSLVPWYQFSSPVCPFHQLLCLWFRSACYPWPGTGSAFSSSALGLESPSFPDTGETKVEDSSGQVVEDQFCCPNPQNQGKPPQSTEL